MFSETIVRFLRPLLQGTRRGIREFRIRHAVSCSQCPHPKCSRSTSSSCSADTFLCNAFNLLVSMSGSRQIRGKNETKSFQSPWTVLFSASASMSVLMMNHLRQVNAYTPPPLLAGVWCPSGTRGHVLWAWSTMAQRRCPTHRLCQPTPKCPQTSRPRLGARRLTPSRPVGNHAIVAGLPMAARPYWMLNSQSLSESLEAIKIRRSND